MSVLTLQEGSSEVAFICACPDWARSACAGENLFGEYEGKKYCVLHYPSPSKTRAFKAVIEKKLRSNTLNFRGVWFPEHLVLNAFPNDLDCTGAFFSRGLDFSNAYFKSKAIFKDAVFGNGAGVGFASATFDGEADFSSATFVLGISLKHATFNSKANFSGAKFYFGSIFEAAKFHGVVNFSKAAFPANAFFIYTIFEDNAFFNESLFSAEADFSSSAFNAGAYFFLTNFSGKADFSNATFNSDVEFNKANFHREVTFRDAVFKSYLGFWGYDKDRIFTGESSATFEYARIEQPEHTTFHTLMLRPSWLTNVDARKFAFTNVDWDWRSVNEEIAELTNRQVVPAHRLLAITYRNLAVNAEENNRYKEASRFRYMAMEARRLERWRGFAFWTLGWWYWLASGYGERAWRAFVVLIGVWLLAAALYTQVGFLRWEPRVSSEGEAAEARRDEMGEPLRWQR